VLQEDGEVGLRLGVLAVDAEQDEQPGADGRDLLAVDAVDARAPDDDRDLLLAGRELIVLVADDVRAELEPVDPERLRPQLAADEPDGASWPGAVELVAETTQRVGAVARPTLLEQPRC